jgi:predicted acyl esterase
MVCTRKIPIFYLTRQIRVNTPFRFIAAERPPHLKAIAPWEGIADYYRELLGRGGIPNDAFVDYRGSGYCGATHSKSWQPMHIAKSPRRI